MHAQKSGAIAVIVGNNIPSKPLMHMVPSDGSADIYIPSVFITREDYDFLIRHLAVYPAGVQVYLTRNPFDTPFWHVLLIGLLGPGGLILTLYFLNLLRQKWLSIYKAHRCQYALIRTRVQPFVPSSQGAESDFCLCTICLETYQEGDLLRVLNCGHGYHKACCDR